jgi:glycosyltransferase involved in cell wall biosynthesis
MFFSRKKIKISYGVTVCNEAAELSNLLATLTPVIDAEDEIIILQDITNKDVRVSEIIEQYKGKVVVIEARLNSDFATFKNNLVTHAKGDYLFQIDADEIPKDSLIKQVKKILRQKSRRDCFLVPRINIVNGLTTEHINNWKWKVDENNRINFPDYQFRIFKLNGLIKWKNPVHEEVIGYKKHYYLPSKNEDYCLIHVKNIDKQVLQNNFYDTIAT